MKPRFGLDCDGLVYSFDWSAARVLVEMGYPDPGPAFVWNHIKNVNPEGWGLLWTLGVDKYRLFRRTEAIDAGAKTLVTGLQHQGWEVVLTTSRPQNAWEDTLWLAEVLGVDDAIRFDSPKDKYLANCDLFVDDSPEAVQALIDKGNPVILYVRDWNKDHIFTTPRPSLEAHNFAEILRHANEFLCSSTQEIATVDDEDAIPERVRIAIREEAKKVNVGPCATAQRLVYGDREAAYDHPSRDLRRIAVFWSEVFGVPVDAQQVALAMVFLKGSRLIGNPTHKDSEDDMAGWAEVRYRERTGA